MAFNAGDFSPSNDHGEVIIALEDMWRNPRIKKQLDTPVESFRAVAENQTATIHEYLKDAYRCASIKAHFLGSCEDTTMECEDFTFDCQIGGEEIGSDSAVFDKNICLVDEFAIMDDECNNLTSFTEKVAYQMELTKAKLRAKLNKKVIAFLDANLMTNTYAGTTGTINGTATEFDAAYWTPDIMAELQMIAIQNQIDNPITLHGTNLWSNQFIADRNACCDGETQRNLLDHFGKYWDPRCIDSFLMEKATFLFDPNQIAFWSAYQFENTEPINANDQYNTHHYRDRDDTITYGNGESIWYDISVQRKCIDPQMSVHARYATCYRISLTGGLALAPDACDAGTGILKFLCK